MIPEESPTPVWHLECDLESYFRGSICDGELANSCLRITLCMVVEENAAWKVTFQVEFMSESGKAATS